MKKHVCNGVTLMSILVSFLAVVSLSSAQDIRVL